MPFANKPSVRFRRIGSALRQAREDAGLTIETAARRFGRSPGWMSTTENGLQRSAWTTSPTSWTFTGFPDGPLRESLLHLAAQDGRAPWVECKQDSDLRAAC